jgi:hypothetical protein
VHLPPLTPHGYGNPGYHPTRFPAWTVGVPMDLFFLKMAERVHRLPQGLQAMQSVMAEHGLVRVG